MSTYGSGGMENGSANAGRSNEFKVVEEQSVMESVTPFDRFGLDEYGKELGWKTQAEHYDGLNEKGAEAPSSRSFADDVYPAFDYSNQLEFHQQEMAEAEERGMPQSQVNYHLGKIAVLQNIPKPPRQEPEHQPDCKKDEGSCSCKK